eukprot:CAMPEP_0206201722 /NCGR_PEP_ID=MMETSP0166-20121206/11729_1 /ASSEMBLY_ACC=CAM_ASM_000260 /TAXON_ID=95228 /ORGANISM="Vannella robusta, Strain DIVA3 518/3/11/1/6" /LENGTH=170 /DNA_ID=CAMNT_0053620475 /DNA_START=69 /DNA_END=581 /DNA_ORIENTATION=+
MKEWKESGKLAFGQVPLLQDGDFNLVQSGTIARYLARKFDMYGDEKTGAISDMIMDGGNDFLNKILPAIYPKLDAEKMTELKKDVIPTFMGHFEKIVGDYVGASGLLGGDKICLGDLLLFLLTESYIFSYQLVDADSYPKLVAHKAKVEENENLQKYIKGDKRYPVRKLE